MPKLKTHRGTAKRVKLTGSGKIVRRRASSHHLLEKKSASRKRATARTAIISGAIAKNIKRALGGIK